MMKSILRIFLIIAVVVSAAFIMDGCGSDRTNDPANEHQAQVSVSLLKTSLAARVDLVRLIVLQDDSLVTQLSTLVNDGTFVFENLVLEIGEYIFIVDGIEIQPEDEELIVYSGQRNVTIGAGNVAIGIDIAPVIPMVRIAPYNLVTQTSATFTSQLELWNIPRFRSGIFTITFDDARMTFVGATPLVDDWGNLIYRTEIEGNQLTLFVTRQSDSDLVPAEHAMFDLSFAASVPGETSLDVNIVEMNNDAGPLPGLESIFEESQDIAITGEVVSVGMIAGVVYDAETSDPIEGAVVEITGPVGQETTTLAEGEFFFLNLPFGVYQVSVSKDGYSSFSRTVSIDSESPVSVEPLSLLSILQQGQYRIELTWGASPSDLDAHSWVFFDQIPYHVYYSDLGSATSIPYMALNIDETHAYGPEVTTIYQLDNPVTFAVHNFSLENLDETTPLTASGARVRVFSFDELLADLSVPTEGAGLWWHVFDLTVDGQVQLINILSDSPPNFGFAPTMKKAKLDR